MISIGDCGQRGRGIFATRPIAGEELIEAAPVVVVPQKQIPQLDATPLGDYYFVWGEESDEAAILLGRCSLCNHSYEPNARFELIPEQQSIAFVALRDIAVGEEITINYNGDPTCREPVWFPTLP